jgi:hypothetical protein
LRPVSVTDIRPCLLSRVKLPDMVGFDWSGDLCRG